MWLNCKVIKKCQSPHFYIYPPFQVYPPPFLVKNFKPPPSDSIFGRSYPPSFNKDGGSSGGFITMPPLCQIAFIDKLGSPVCFFLQKLFVFFKIKIKENWNFNLMLHIIAFLFMIMPPYIWINHVQIVFALSEVYWMIWMIALSTGSLCMSWKEKRT